MKLKLFSALVIASAGVLASTPTLGQEAADETADIRAQSEAFVAAFNKQDAKAIAALWTENGEYIDHTGNQFNGREAIEAGYAQMFNENPNAQIQITIDSLRLLSNDTAIEDGRAVAASAEVPAVGFSKYTSIHVKVDGQWKMASVRDAFIEPPPAASSAADLQWLIGTWVAEEQGVKTTAVCRWAVDDRFLECRYTSTHVDGSMSSGLRLVGWNPLAGHIQSWSFSPDGGHTVETWLPEQSGWVAQVHGITGDGVPTTSTVQLRKLDDDAYVWQSLQRNVGGRTLPDTVEVVWKRQSASAE